ncbi:MAG TPA: hypothetical protein VE978_25890 [Chitinophagales bacterium]|nr:hypothetical protein [Chitinophagales bacterium]
MGQDTIRLDKSVHYSSSTEPYRSKYFASCAKYAREVIVFSDTHKRIEYCYYYDNERFCFGKTYKLTDDSVLDMDEEKWVYKKQGDKYFVNRFFKGTYESGYAISLMPFETTGIFTTTTSDKIDTLWTTDYSADHQDNPYDHPKYEFHKTRVSGKIYDAKKIDELPAFLNGDSIKEISLRRTDGCIGEPFYYVRTMTFVITKEGRIVNIEQDYGNFDLDFCPYYVMDLIRLIYQLSPVKPAKVKGESVNVRWIVKVNMNDD